MSVGIPSSSWPGLIRRIGVDCAEALRVSPMMPDFPEEDHDMK